MADRPGSSPTLLSRLNHHPAAAAHIASPLHQQAFALEMAPPATASTPQAQFHRFRLTDFQRVQPPATAPAGQCSRFRVTDFIPYESGGDVQSPSRHSGVAGGSSGQANSSTSNASPRMSNATANAGSFSVMHMDVDGAAAQATSNSVAATGGHGMLQKVHVPVQRGEQSPQTNQHQHRPLAPVPSQVPPAGPPVQAPGPVPYPAVKFEPSLYPEDVRWELARVLSSIQSNPADLTSRVTAALLAAPSLEDNSFLSHMMSLYPIAPPAPTPAPQLAEEQTPPKRKRGRPPGKKKQEGGESAVASGSMPPPPVPDISVVPTRKEKDSVQPCTRCLKDFNPAWRPTPASDPSSEATCAVRHPYADFASGLVVSLPARKRNNYKTTWRWRCCGREIQSSGSELTMFPQKEDDKTGGWCFVGKHTTEPGVRSKVGLKSGKGKTIDEVAGMLEIGLENARKRAKLDDTSKDDASGEQQEEDEQQWGMEQQDPAPTFNDPEPSPPPKRKRGRPKGSKSKNKLQPPSAAPAPQPPSDTAPQTHSPTSQLLAEASSQPQPTFWTQYTEPAPPTPAPQPTAPPPPPPDEDIGITTAELGMLVNATAAMASSAKRGRGRPKGVKNGAGRVAVERKRAEMLQQQQQQQQRQVQQQQQIVQQQQVQQDELQHHHGLGVGDGWFPGDEQWSGFA